MADNLWLSFIADEPDNTILYCSSADGNNWGSSNQLVSFWASYAPLFGSPPTQNSPLAPASAFFNNQIFIAWTGSGDSQVVVCSAPSFMEWGQWSEQDLQNQTMPEVTSQQTWTGQYSPSAPSLAVFNGRLYVAFVGTDADHPVLVCSTSDGVNWSNYTKTGQQTLVAPSLAVFNGRLYVAFVGTDADHPVLVCSTSDGVNWSNYTKTGHSSKAAPSLAVFNGRLYLAYVGADADDFNVYVTSTANGTNWTAKTPTGQYSHVAPSLAAYDNQLYVAYVADDGTDNLYVTSTANGTWWGNNTKTGQSSKVAPSLAVAPFPANVPLTYIELYGDPLNIPVIPVP